MEVEEGVHDRSFSRTSNCCFFFGGSSRMMDSGELRGSGHLGLRFLAWGSIGGSTFHTSERLSGNGLSGKSAVDSKNFQCSSCSFRMKLLNLFLQASPYSPVIGSAYSMSSSVALQACPIFRLWK